MGLPSFPIKYLQTGQFFYKKRLTASLKTFNLYIIVPLKTDASEARPT